MSAVEPGDLVTWTRPGDPHCAPQPGVVVATEATPDGDTVIEVRTLHGGTVCVGESDVTPVAKPQVGQVWRNVTHRVEIEAVHGDGLLCDVVHVAQGRRVPVRDVAVVGYYELAHTVGAR